jgi:uncharacterized membrane protein
MTKDTKTRSITKAIIWRIIAIITTAFVTVLYTHQWEVALSVGGLTGVINLILYYFHERIWENISWGKMKSKKK